MRHGWCGMRTTDPGDAARVELLLAELRLPAIKLVWASLAAQADTISAGSAVENCTGCPEVTRPGPC
jgi:hypothetical protein